MKCHTIQTENAKTSVPDLSTPTPKNEIKDIDDNVTITCHSNERTPLNFLFFKIL